MSAFFKNQKILRQFSNLKSHFFELENENASKRNHVKNTDLLVKFHHTVTGTQSLELKSEEV